MSVCTGIKLVQKIDDITDILLVTIDNEVDAYMIYSYAECLKFLNEEVIVSYRKDIYEGRIEQFINTLTIPTRVTALDRTENIKLFCDIDDNNSNVCFSDIQLGETFIGAIMYCVDCQYESSNKAVWMTIKVRDKSGRVAKVRLFDYTTEGLVYNGIYVKADIKKTKFGFNTDAITPMELDYPPNPEIEIAKDYIRNYFADDAFMCNVFNVTSILDHMEMYISLEKGYELVRLAIQLDILGGLRNCFDDIDFKAISYALVFGYGYITKSGLSEYSPELRTTTFALQNSANSRVLKILDNGTVDEPIRERDVYKKILALAESVVTIKKEAS